MGAILPTKYTTPDGVERLLRFTLGAQRRIAADFGIAGIQDILNQYDYGAVPRLIYHCLYDAQGNPPADITAAQFEETFPGGQEAGKDALAALLAAMTQGQTSKNDVEALIDASIAAQTGSSSGASAVSASGSQTPNSGTLPQPSSTVSPEDTGPTNDSPTTEPES